MLKSNRYVYRLSNYICSNSQIYHSTIRLQSNELNKTDDLLNNKLKVALNQRLIKNEPFIKNLFCGRYIYDYLKYPEYEKSHELNTLNNDYVLPVSTYFSSSSYDSIIDKNGNFSVQALDKFKTLNLYSISIPKEYSGSELDSIGIARVLEETAIYPSLGMQLIYNNEIAAKSILIYGSLEQKKKYLKRIALGELKACFCYSELDNGVDESRFNVSSKLDDNQSGYILNGKKSWISMITNDEDELHKDNDAVFVVFSKTNESSNDEDKDTALNAFIVESNTPGVTIKKQLTNYNGLNLYEIEFDNVRISNQNLLGINGSGHEISNKIVENSRHFIGALCTGLIKNLFERTVKFVVDSRRFDRSLTELQIIKDRICDIERKIYAMESLTYMTAAIQDSFEQPDIGCEAALTKIYCTENLKTCADSCLEILAMGSYSKLSEVQNRYLLDLNYLSTMLNTNDFLRLYVSTNGTILAGVEFSDSLLKIRNPLMNIKYCMKKIYANYKLEKSVNKKSPEYLYLWEHVHPSLGEAASTLEKLTVKFMTTIKYSLLTHGRNAVTYQYNMKHLADIAMHLYALNSVIARASRSYSIGLSSSQFEISLAHLQANEAKLVVDRCFDEISKLRSGQNFDNTKTNIADNVFKKKKHAATHSLTRNY